MSEPVTGTIWFNRPDLGVSPKRRRTATPGNGVIRMPLTRLAQRGLRDRGAVTARLRGVMRDRSGVRIVMHGAVRFTRAARRCGQSPWRRPSPARRRPQSVGAGARAGPGPAAASKAVGLRV
jgi:hypothetical protein